MAPRSIAPAIVQLDGNRVKAATYLSLARSLLGDVINRAELGGVEVGGRTFNMPDGSVISAVISGVVNIIRIYSPEVPGLGDSPTPAFIIHPFSDTAPNGWWFASSTATSRTPRPTVYYPRFSLGSTYQPFYREQGILRVDGNKKVVIDRDLNVWPANQWTSIDEGATVWSWWHSPHGDAALMVMIPGDQVPTKELFLPFISENGTFCYASKTTYPFTVNPIYPAVFKNGVLVWRYATDSEMIGGLHPLDDNQFLVMMVSNKQSRATLYLATITPYSAAKIADFLAPPAIDTTDGHTLNYAAYFAFRWPWKFSPKGDECSALLLYQGFYDINAVTAEQVYDITQKLTIRLSQDPITGAWSASEIGRTDYVLYYQEDTNNNDVSTTDGDDSHMYWDWNRSQSRTLQYESAPIPVALTYNDKGQQVICWGGMEGSSLSDTSTYSGSCHYGSVYSAPNELGPVTTLAVLPFVYNYQRTASKSNPQKIYLELNGVRTYLLDHLSQSSSLSSVEWQKEIPNPPVNDPTYGDDISVLFSYSRNSKSTLTQEAVLFIDVKKNIIITATCPQGDYYTEATNSGSIEWAGIDPSINSIDKPASGVTYYQGRLILNGNPVYDDAQSISFTSSASYLRPQIPIVPEFQSGSLSESKRKPLAKSHSVFSSRLIGTGFQYGAAVDQNGFYLFSYLVSAYQSGAYSTPKRTGNISNIGTISGAINASVGSDNPLLFPLGVSSIWP